MKRNYGIDAARIVAIWFVVCGHIVTCGGILAGVPKYQWPLGRIFLDCLTVCCVDVFGLISGYVGLHGRHRFSGLLNLWLQVFIINAVISLGYVLVSNVHVDIRDVLFPVLRRSYWYFSAYVPLFLLMPILNIGIRGMSKERSRILCVMMISILSLSRLLVGKEPFSLDGGYSFAWLLILYVLGGCLNRAEFKPRKNVCFTCFGASVAIGCGIVQCLGKSVQLQDVLRGTNPFYGYCSPIVVIGSIFLLLGLCSWQSFFERHKKIVAFFSASAFGVYLIHVQPLIWRNLFVNKFSFLADFQGWMQICAIIELSIGIYVLCSLLDWVRILAFRYFKVAERLRFIDRMIGDERIIV